MPLRSRTDREIEHEERDRDREHAVAERLESPRRKATPDSGAARSPTGSSGRPAAE